MVSHPSTGAFQISLGLGAGNIGDELMARAFWQRLPRGLSLDVPLFPESRRQHEPYPPQHRYLAVEWDGNENASANVPGLLVGGTPITESEGLHFPLRFLAPRLESFHRQGLPVDALGVGVDQLHSAEALSLFRERFGPVQSWTVRSFACRDALVSMGIPGESIVVGADWAWLYQPQRNLNEWAKMLWRQLGIDPERPLLAANVVNMVWREALEARRGIAGALDQASIRFGLQIAFFCNECRDGEFFDFAAATEISKMMSAPATLVPNEYYSPDEALALLGCASIAVGQRYHFLIQAALAGVAAVGILRGQKIKSLATELGIPVGGSVDHVDRDTLCAAIDEAVTNRAAVLFKMTEARRRLTSRAELNLSLCHLHGDRQSVEAS